MKAFLHLHETIQAINRQRKALNGNLMSVLISTDKESGDVSIAVREETYSNRTDIHIALGKDLEDACHVFLAGAKWDECVDALLAEWDAALRQAEERRDTELEKLNKYIDKIRELPKYRARPEDPLPPPEERTRYDHLSSVEAEDDDP